MSIQIKYEELIESSYKELETLKSEVTQLEDIRKNIEILIGSNNELPKIFEEKFKKIIQLSEDYTNTLGAATKNYLDGNNTLFTTKLSELSTKIKEFEKEITRLVNTDFTKLFKDLQKDFIDQTRADLTIELKKFDEKSKVLQIKIDELKKQIERLENIDVEKHFAILQKTLSDIFGAVNAINLTLTTLLQSINSVVQNLIVIQNAIEKNHEEVKKILVDLNKVTETHLSDQDKDAKINAVNIENGIQLLFKQNVLLKNDIKTNKIISIISFGITIILLCFLIYKHLHKG